MMWLSQLRRYVLFLTFANFAWEVAQLPLYTIWQHGNWGQIAFAVTHCTGGDLLIGTAALILALLLFGDADWPTRCFQRVVAATVLFGVCYTIFSEWLNVEIRGSWAYSDRMPVVPIIGTGLSPLAQWIVIPLAAFWWAHPGHPTHG